MFKDTGRPLQKLIDSGSKFIDVASAHTQEKIKLLDTGLKVLETQQGKSENIKAVSRDIASLTEVLKKKDGEMRKILQLTTEAATETDGLTKDIARKSNSMN